MYSPTLTGVPWCNLTKYLADFYLFVFPSYSTVSVEVISSILMRMRKLIWVCTSRKSLIVPNEFSQSPHSVSPKIRFIPLFSKKIFSKVAMIRHQTTTHNSGTFAFPEKITKIQVEIPGRSNSHIPLPRMKKPRARNGNVTRNRGGYS